MNPKFRYLLKDFPRMYRKCREENTVNRHLQYFKGWRKWAKLHEVCFFPIAGFHVALYLLSKIQTAHSFPIIEASFYAIKFFRKPLLNTDPRENVIIINMLELAKRIWKRTLREKRVLSVSELTKISGYLSKNENSLIDQWLLTIIIVFCGFMRFGEISKIRRSDITFHDQFIKIFTEKS